MSRIFTNPNPTFYKQDGVTVNTNGKIYFYEPGSGSTTLKSVYSNKGLTIELTNPVILDSVGKLTTPIWLNGDYNIKITDSADVQIDRFDNYEPADLSAQFSDFDATITYAQNDFVRDTNGKYYQSLSAGNVGNDPSSSPAYWVEIYFLDVWNTNKTYAVDDIVKYGDDIFVSLVGSNLGNTPSTGSAFWRSFFFPATETGFAATSFEYLADDTAIGSALDVDANITRATWETVGPTGSGADYIWTALDNLPSNAKSLVIRGNIDAGGSGTTVSYEVRARRNGSTSIPPANVMQQRATVPSGTTNLEETTDFNVRVDGDLIFEVYWDDVGTANRDIAFWLLGFKV